MSPMLSLGYALRRDMYLRDDGSPDQEGARRISEALAAILRA